MLPVALVEVNKMFRENEFSVFSHTAQVTQSRKPNPQSLWSCFPPTAVSSYGTTQSRTWRNLEKSPPDSSSPLPNIYTRARGLPIELWRNLRRNWITYYRTTVESIRNVFLMSSLSFPCFGVTFLFLVPVL